MKVFLSLVFVFLFSVVSYAQAPTMTDAQKVDMLEAQITAAQKIIAQKDSAIAQLLAENAQFREQAANAKQTEITNRLITKAGGTPGKDAWDFNTMTLTKTAPPPTPDVK